MWIARGVWDDLTSEQQKVIQEVSFEAAYRDRDQVVGAGGKSIDALKAKGVQFHGFPDAEKKRWKDANPDFFGDFIEDQKAAGRGDAAMKTIEIWNAVVGG